jgi:hypothetical protein
VVLVMYSNQRAGNTEIKIKDNLITSPFFLSITFTEYLCSHSVSYTILYYTVFILYYILLYYITSLCIIFYYMALRFVMFDSSYPKSTALSHIILSFSIFDIVCIGL